jgi:hypothetical protein
VTNEQLAHLELSLLRDRLDSIRGELAELPVKRSGIEQQNGLLGGLDYSMKQVNDACALLPLLEIGQPASNRMQLATTIIHDERGPHTESVYRGTASNGQTVCVFEDVFDANRDLPETELFNADLWLLSVDHEGIHIEGHFANMEPSFEQREMARLLGCEVD